MGAGVADRVDASAWRVFNIGERRERDLDNWDASAALR